MPFIKSKINISATNEQEMLLKSLLGKAIELIPGKSEQSLLVEFENNCHLWLRGKDNKPIAYIEVSIFGNENHEGFSEFTYAVAQIYHDILHIPLKNLYIKFDDISSWGAGSQFIDRKKLR